MPSEKARILAEMAKLADEAGRAGEPCLRNFLQMGLLGARLPASARRWLVGKGMLLLNGEMEKERKQ